MEYSSLLSLSSDKISYNMQMHFLIQICYPSNFEIVTAIFNHICFSLDQLQFAISSSR